ncbi:sugar MFS transporter [Olivibacter sp. XZL3]|uniref:sugar MFS transporter n=1 Tax=Olivibacter sp. XZL3 TaxID=1735116 RepID=UPI00106649C3|nr:sugar MFS transporter [Olivibacter sp. XZL3]
MKVRSYELRKRDTIFSVAIIGTLFFVFGFISWVNALLIPYFKIACELTHFQSYLVAFAFYISYLVISLPAGYLLKRVGFKRGMMIGFWIMVVGALIFVPAAMTRTYLFFLVGLFSLGAGLSILQTAANPYITVIGPRESAAQRISVMGICNKGAGILAPLILAAALLREGDQVLFDSLPYMDEVKRSVTLDAMIRRVILPYSIVGAVLFVLGIVVRYSPLPELDTEYEDEHTVEANAGKTSILQFPHLVLGAVAIFLHVGTQVIAIDTIINYAGGMGLSLVEAKNFPSYTLTATIIGYLAGIVFIPRFVSQLTTIKCCTGLGLLLSILIISVRHPVDFWHYEVDISIWFVVLLGLANSLIWAGIWPLALDGLGKFTKLGGAILIMGLCGNALLPLGYGILADQYGLRFAYIILVPCYVYLIFYAFFGYKWRRWIGLKL